MTVFSQRRRRLLSLAKGKQVVAVTAPNLFYLTSFFGGGVAVVHPDKTVVVTFPLEADRAGEMCQESEIVVVKKRKDLTKEVVRQLDKGKVVTDEDRAFKGERFGARPQLFLDCRRVKDEVELELIRKACAGTDRAYEALEQAMKPRKSEWQLAAEVMKVALEQGMTPSNSDSSLGPVIIASGMMNNAMARRPRWLRAFACMPKPFTCRELRAAVRAAIASKKTCRTAALSLRDRRFGESGS